MPCVGVSHTHTWDSGVGRSLSLALYQLWLLLCLFCEFLSCEKGGPRSAPHSLLG